MRIRTDVSMAIAWTSAALVAAAFFSLYAAPRLPSRLSMLLVSWVCLTAPLCAAFATFALRGRSALLPSLLAAATPATAVAAALAAFLVIDGASAQATVAGVTVLFVALFMAYWRGMERGDRRFRSDDFAHLSFAIHVVGMFFLLLGLLGIGDFVPVPLPAVVGIVGLVSLVTVAETLRRSGAAMADIFPTSSALALIMAESTVALAQLPTDGLVSAMIGTVMFAACLHAVTVILVPTERPHPFRRHFALSCAIVILVMSTARWA